MRHHFVLVLTALAILASAAPSFAQKGVKDLVKRELGQAQETREEQAKQAGVTNQTPPPPAADKPLTAVAAATAALDPTRSAGWLTVAAADGIPVRLFFSHPHLPAANLPALIVVQEWWGVTQDIQTRTNEFAGKGYFSLAVDLYDGQATADPKKAAELKAKLTDPAALIRLKTGLDVLAELAKLKTVNADRTGVIGWCMGGEQALKLAVADRRVKATAIFYGPLITDAEQLKNLQGPVLGIFGNLDPKPSPADVTAFQTALVQNHIALEIHRYDGAGHAFASRAAIPLGMYREKQSADAWAKTYAWLEKTLKSPTTAPATQAGAAAK
ncbi:MAG: dienelactone hydrolase family protein [Phycisphaerae bacterium]